MDALGTLAGLDDEQRAVAEAVSGPVVVLAGAGTGKTRAITHRIAHGVASGAMEASRVLAVTFTTKAAGEMRGRLAQLGAGGVQARTFHAAALRQLRYFWPRLSSSGFPSILESKARIVASAARSSGTPVSGAALRDLVTDIEWALARELDPAHLPESRTWSMDRGSVATVLAAYEDAKREGGLIDFEDVLAMLGELLETRPDIADEVRAQYRWFTVDEYQDVSPLQHRLLRHWLGGRDELCVVGDVSQTIYSFAGASAQYLLEFSREYPHATAVRLVQCYRSTEPIVAMANSLVAGQPGALLLRSVPGDGPAPQITAYADDQAEADAVASLVRARIDAGESPASIAVLYRINAQSAELERAMAERSVPVALRGSERFFQRPEVREAVTRLRGAARAGASGPAGQEARAVLIEAGWQSEAPATTGAVRERWESLAAIIALADAAPTLSELVEELDRRAEAQHAPSADAVTLASLHSAKGLEWDRVIIIGCSDGLIPFAQASSDEALAEERRLLYVGITRARRHLHLTWSRSRQPGKGSYREPSRFLDTLQGAGLAAGAGDDASVRRGSGTRTRERGRKAPARCRICRKALVTPPERTMMRCRTCPSSIDPALLDALREWRSATAREREVPAYVVFTDATLAAIAEHRPSTSQALLDIPGIGPAKLEAYGSTVLRLVDEFPEAGDPPIDLTANRNLRLELAEHSDATEPDSVDEGI